MFHFKEEDIQRALDIVRYINIPEKFGPYEDSETVDLDDFEDAFYNCIGKDFHLDRGISKLVIIVKDLPFVIKIPFNGMWYAEDHYDEEEDEYWTDYYFDYYSTNYCDREYELTRAIEDAGFEMFVPRMARLCEVNGVTIYIQEKVIPTNEMKSGFTPSEDSLKKAKEYHLNFNCEWMATALEVYGEDVWAHFIEWGNNPNYDLFDDMHTGNYGMDMAGRPVIFDISGFDR